MASPTTSSASGNSESATHVRLPKLSLPTFSGKYDEWFPFYDAFNSIIHSNVSLNNVQKLQYLRASLTGQANDVINSLEISDRNYEVAWQLLRERCDNKRVIVHTYVKAIMELPSMNKENAHELRQIADGASKHIHALQALKRPTNHWDDVLVYVLSSKLDSITMREWQTSLAGSELPTFKQLVDFIVHRCQVLEATGKSGISGKFINARSQPNGKRQSACVATLKYKCTYCNGEHSIYNCQGFLTLPIHRRIAEIRKLKVCHNCLRSTDHVVNKCKSGNCKICKAKHNTLLHPATATKSPDRDQDKQSNREDKVPAASPTALVTHLSRPFDGKYVMLSTAVVQAYDSRNLQRPCRMLLDCGSQANFVSKRFVSMLSVKPRSLNVSISGISGSITRSTQTIRLKMQSRLNPYSFELDFIVTDQVTDKLPSFTFNRGDFELPRNLPLADLKFHESSEIDALIGVDLFWDLLCIGQINASLVHPTLQKTRLGWILASRCSGTSKPMQKIQSCHATITNTRLHQELDRFWQQEDITDKWVNHTIEEIQCEEHFLANVTQTHGGKYMVKLPVKEQVITKLGDSREIAMRRLKSLEKRFKREPTLKSQYKQFLKEYVSLGHMKLITNPSDETSKSLYLPHHCVFKSSKQSVKIRVVFDVSCKSSTGVSLNDALVVGPVVQQDLMSILMRFRTFRYVIVADIIKMYRQIFVDPLQTSLQRILWRDEEDSEVNTYELVTVVYGTASASYLATRCFKHLAEQHATKYPVGSKHVERDFYVDDLLTGADTFSEAKIIRDEIVQLLRLGSFELSKWASNCPELLGNISDQSHDPVAINDDMNSRVLGMQWNQSEDTFQISHNNAHEFHGITSKRTILSEAARLFDPLGLVRPVVVVAKSTLQDLWQSGTHWDESVSQAIHERWSRFKKQLPELNRLQVPRCVKYTTDPRLVQIHGFYDASQRAYGACIYVRMKIEQNQYRTELLCSKSRIAPLKVISLPRLELSAALLLARLLEKVSSSIDLSHLKIFLWTDSTITLNWISSPSRKWAVFVANRVGEIQCLTTLKDWRHIASSDNPADILSRGLFPNELAGASLWWHGPMFSQVDKNHWPSSDIAYLGNDIPERLEHSVAAVIVNDSVVDDLLNKHSGLNKVHRIIAYCLRFRKSHRTATQTEFISHAEISYARGVACKVIQRNAFPVEYRALSKAIPINASSRLASLSPFMDDFGLIRVGGRLKNSDLRYDGRHSVLLPHEHEFTKRIITQEHVRNLHDGAQATMAAVRQRFWPLSLRSTTRRIIQNCITCYKVKPTQSEAFMGSLPSSRVTVSKPFSHCGVDYAGPIILRESKRRNARNHKAYIAIFVCFATKGVHIESGPVLATLAPWARLSWRPFKFKLRGEEENPKKC